MVSTLNTRLYSKTSTFTQTFPVLININMSQDLFKNKEDYWNVAENIRNLYLSEGSLLTLLDFERVLDSVDIYAFKNWALGELVEGPNQGSYTVSCTFMWPKEIMPDPRGAKRLLPFDCSVTYNKRTIEIPVEVKTPDDYEPGTKLGRLIKKPVWLVEIVMPKALMSDIRSGSIELEDQVIDLQDLDDSYANDLDQESVQDTDAETETEEAQEEQNA